MFFKTSRVLTVNPIISRQQYLVVCLIKQKSQDSLRQNFVNMRTVLRLIAT